MGKRVVSFLMVFLLLQFAPAPSAFAGPAIKPVVAVAAVCGLVLVLGGGLVGLARADRAARIERVETANLGVLTEPVKALWLRGDFEAIADLEEILRDPVSAGVSVPQMRAAIPFLTQWIQRYRYAEYFQEQSSGEVVSGVLGRNNLVQALHIVGSLRAAIESDANGMEERDILAEVLMTMYEVSFVSGYTPKGDSVRFFPDAVTKELDSLFETLLGAEAGISEGVRVRLAATVAARASHVETSWRSGFSELDSQDDLVPTQSNDGPAFYLLAPGREG